MRHANHLLLLIYRVSRKLEEICRLHLLGINDASAILWRERSRRHSYACVSGAKLTNPHSPEAERNIPHPREWLLRRRNAGYIFRLILPVPFQCSEFLKCQI